VIKIDVTLRGLAACLCISTTALLAACGGTAPAGNTAATNTAASNVSPSSSTSSTTSAADEGTPALKQAAKEVDEALKKAGYTNTQVSIKSNTIQIKGTVPPGKLQDAQNTARNAAGANATMIELYQENPK
jgi:hypothetical protein